jgi:trans-aconitate methyltransferase
VPVTLLDLGCGSGRITEQFAPYFSDIIAVDPDIGMIKLARQRLRAYPAHALHSTAEDAELPDGWRASLVIISRAFHWMTQQVVLKRLEDIVAEQGVIAVFSDNSFWHIDTEWGRAVRQILAQYLGSERRTLMGSYQEPKEYFGKTFTSPVFTNLSWHVINITREWTADQIVGYLFSTSFASRPVLGDKAETFEQHLRARLHEISPNDLFTEPNHFDVLLARRS